MKLQEMSIEFNIYLMKKNRIIWYNLIILGVVILIFSNGCKKTSTPGEVPVVGTSNLSNITSTTATCGGNIVNDEGSSITACGVCWSTYIHPTPENNKTKDTDNDGSFTSNITGLTASTTYYVRAYAISNNGTGYGSEMTFKTLGPVPNVTTSAITGITQTTANCGGDVTDDGGSTVIARGICWNTVVDPTIANSKTVDGNGTGSYSSSMTALTANTTYYVRAYAITLNGTGYGNEITFKTLGPVPNVTTSSITSITQTSAICGGDVTDDGGSTVIARGACWSTILNPTIADNKTVDGSGTGSYSSSITGLLEGTTYYVRAYAINTNGIGYGSNMSFITQPPNITDVDGNIYHAVIIGTQVWMIENLKTTRYNDGSSIPLVTDPYEWIGLTSDGYCWSENDPNNKDTYGALYNWYAVNTGKLAPTGWHVPTDEDWNLLINFAGGTTTAGGKLKASGTNYWNPPNTGATDDYGFDALPGGYRSSANGTFVNLNYWGVWWSATGSNGSIGRLLLENVNAIANYDHDIAIQGFSIRCIKN